MRMPQKKYIIFAGIILVVIGASATAAYILSQQSAQPQVQPDKQDDTSGVLDQTHAVAHAVEAN